MAKHRHHWLNGYWHASIWDTSEWQARKAPRHPANMFCLLTVKRSRLCSCHLRPAQTSWTYKAKRNIRTLQACRLVLSTVVASANKTSPKKSVLHSGSPKKRNHHHHHHFLSWVRRWGSKTERRHSAWVTEGTRSGTRAWAHVREYFAHHTGDSPHLL